MTRVFVFADESGDFVFTNEAPQFFVLRTLTLLDCSIGTALLDLRRELARDGHDLIREFHATNDHPKTRERVYGLLEAHEFRFDVTLAEKRKVHPDLQRDTNRFYKTMWRLHMQYVAPCITNTGDDVLVVAASIKTNVKRQMVIQAISDVIREAAPDRLVVTQPDGSRSTWYFRS